MANTIASLLVKLGIDTQQFHSGIDAAERQARGLGGTLAGPLAIGAVAGAAAVAGIGIAAVKVAAEFEQAMANVRAVSGATGEEFAALDKLAMKLGKDTVFSAKEAAGGIEELVKGGISIADILDGAATATLNLATAGGVALPEAAEIASNALAMFGLQGRDMAHVADLVAGAANASSLSVTDFRFSLAMSGAVARTAGQSFDDLALAIAIMGQQGLKGMDAGTSLKTMLLNLIPNTKTAREEMQRLGIITADGANLFVTESGAIKGMADIAGILQEKTAGLTESERLMSLQTIFGTDAVRAAAIMARTGAAGFGEMATAMGKVTAESVAATKLDTFSGSLKQLQGSWETLLITIGKPMLPVLRGFVDGLTGFTNTLIDQVEPALKDFEPQWDRFMRLFSELGTGNFEGFKLDFARMLDDIGESLKTWLRDNKTNIEKGLEDWTAAATTGAGKLGIGIIEQLQGMTPSVEGAGYDMGRAFIRGFQRGLADLMKPGGDIAKFLEGQTGARYSPQLGAGFPGTAFPEMGGAGEGQFEFVGIRNPVQAWGFNDIEDMEQTVDEIAAISKKAADIPPIGPRVPPGGGAAAKASMGEFISSLIATHAAVIAANEAVATWRARVDDVSLAIVANRDQIKAAEAAYKGMADVLAGLNEQLSKAKTKLSDLASTKITGQGMMDDQIAAVEKQIKRLQFAASTGLSPDQIAKMFPMLTAGMDTYVNQLPSAIKGNATAAASFLDSLRQMKDLRYNEQLDLIKKAAEGAKAEMNYTDIIKGIGETKTEIGKLTLDVQTQESAMKAQRAVVDGLKDAGDKLNDTLRDYQKNLQLAEIDLGNVTKALQLAYDWFLNDQAKIEAMGGEAKTQAELIDETVRGLLGSMDSYASGIETNIKNVLDAAIAKIDAMKAAIARLNKDLGEGANYGTSGLGAVGMPPSFETRMGAAKWFDPALMGGIFSSDINAALDRYNVALKAVGALMTTDQVQATRDLNTAQTALAGEMDRVRAEYAWIAEHQTAPAQEQSTQYLTELARAQVLTWSDQSRRDPKISWNEAMKRGGLGDTASALNGQTASAPAPPANVTMNITVPDEYTVRRIVDQVKREIGGNVMVTP